MARVVTQAPGGGALQDVAYTRAATGRIAGVASANRPLESWLYSYDDLDQVLAANNVGDAALSQTFSYDAARNMLLNSAVGAYAYPTQGPGAVRPHAVTQAGPYALSYDAAGNLISKIGRIGDSYFFGGLRREWVAWRASQSLPGLNG